jgi:hypothetical protein
MKLIKLIAASMVVVLLASGGLAAYFWQQRTIWPAFPPATTQDPQVAAQVEPDFGWRTGDHVPMVIYIRQQPNTTVDVNSLAMEGDFEIAKPPQVFVRDTKDGARYIRVDLVLQSVHVAPKLTLKANMSYSVEGSNEIHAVSLPGLELYTSRTWDGRMELKDGPLAAKQGYHWWYTIGALLAGFLGLLGSYGYMRKIRAEYVPPLVKLSAWEQARVDFVTVWARIQQREDTEADYKEIERIIRRLYRVEPRTLYELQFELGINHPHYKQIKVILTNTGKVLYKQQVLSDAEKIEIFEAFQQIFGPQIQRIDVAAQ